MKNCRDCANCRNMPQAGPVYELTCTAPEIMSVIDTEGGNRNTSERCNETRAFKFACGHGARWFVPRTQP